MRFQPIILVLLAMMAAAAAQAETIRWAVLTNGRFGTTVDYPSSVFTQALEPAVNGASNSRSTSDGKATFSIGGTWRSNLGTPREEAADEVARAEGEISYVRATERFYVVSGTTRGAVFYRRCNYPISPDGIVDCLTLSYPAAEEKWWDPIVTRMSRSLRGVQTPGGEYRIP